MTEKEIDEKIKSLVDKEFLERLTEVAKLVGWSVDYIEVQSFLSELYGYAELEEPDFTPYYSDEYREAYPETTT